MNQRDSQRLVKLCIALYVLAVIILLCSCSSFQEKIDNCLDRGLEPEVYYLEVLYSTCDCDNPSTFHKPCKPGSVIALTDGRYCGVSYVPRVKCMPKQAPLPEGKDCKLWDILGETCNVNSK